MRMLSIYEPATTELLTSRINELKPNSSAKWGKMNVAQMLAHCSASYEQITGERNEKPPFFMRLMVKMFFKQSMINEVPYKQNLPTAPSFVMKDEKDFEKEKTRLIELVKKVGSMKADVFEGREQATIGVINATEWSNLMYKHIDHHLRQFGV